MEMLTPHLPGKVTLGTLVHSIYSALSLQDLYKANSPKIIWEVQNATVIQLHQNCTFQ